MLLWKRKEKYDNNVNIHIGHLEMFWFEQKRPCSFIIFLFFSPRKNFTKTMRKHIDLTERRGFFICKNNGGKFDLVLYQNPLVELRL